MVIRGLQWLLLLLVVPAKVFMADGEIDLDPCRAFHAGSVPGQRIVVTMDLYHHKAPEDLPAEKQPAVFRGNLGRYTWCDRHVNGFSALRLLLWQQGYLTRNLRQEITPATLNGTDILIIQNPDSKAYKAYRDEGVPIAAEEIAAVVEFVRQGGRLLVMANSSPDSRGREPYERYSLNRLGSPFGVYLEQKDSGDVKVPVPDSHRYLGDVKSFQYGQGCIMALSARTGVRHEVILTYQNEPIIVLAQLGLGKALFVGDVSPLSNQPLNRIGVDNIQTALRLFELLKPDRSGRDKSRGSIRVGKRFHKSTAYHHSAVRHVKVIQKFDHPLKANPSIAPREKYRWMELERTLEAEVGDATEFPILGSWSGLWRRESTSWE